MSSYTCDVLVIGGGPAGLAAAIALRMHGADVLVVDVLKPPIDKACGEGLMPDARYELEALGVDYGPQDGALFHGIRFTDWMNAEPLSVAAEFSKGKGLGISRTTLHMRMVERAQELGVRFRWGTYVAFGTKIMLGQDECCYRYLVGADGQSSRVRMWAGLGTGRVMACRFGFRRHYQVAPWSQFVEVHWTDLGQAYITPVSEDEICVAVVTRNNPIRVQQFLDTVPFLNERLPYHLAADDERGAVTVTRKLKRAVKKNVALIGDASGSVDAITGEGMALSFRQAMLCSESLMKNDLEIYSAGHQKILSRSQWMTRLLLLMDAYPSLRSYAMRVLAGSPELFQGLIDLHLSESTISQFLLRHGTEVIARLAFPNACLSEQ